MHFSYFPFCAAVLGASFAAASPMKPQVPSKALEMRAPAVQAPSSSGTAAIMGSGTYPRATILSNGSLLGVYTASSGGDSIITTVKSTDSGASWSPLGTVVQGPTASTDIDNGYVHQLPSGRVLCAYRNHDRAGSSYSFYRITISYSDDNGATWKYLSTAASDSNPVNGDWEPFLMDALDGSLMIFYSRENAADDQDSLLRRSTDGGATWSNAQVISGANITARDGMVGATRTAPSSPTILAVFESGVNGLFSIHSVKSTDDGATWGDRSTVYEADVAGKSAGAPGITRVGDHLVASFGTDEDGDSTWPVGAMKMVVSADGGDTWGSKTTVHAAPAEWAGLLDLDDESFLAMYESGQSYAQKFVF